MSFRRLRIAEDVAEWAKKLDPKEAPPIVKWLLKQASEDPSSAEIQAARLMSAWNAAGPEARQEFMRRIKEIKCLCVLGCSVAIALAHAPRGLLCRPSFENIEMRLSSSALPKLGWSIAALGGGHDRSVVRY
jgi:hypothetical protein